MADRQFIVLLGPPASGKTALAHALAPRIGALVLNSDDLTQPLFGDDRNSAEYVAWRPKLYDALYVLAETNLRLGWSAIVDGPHAALLSSEGWLAKLRGIAERSTAKLAFVRCDCDPDIRRTRMQARGERRDEAKLANWSGHVATQPDWHGFRAPHLIVDTGVAIEAAVDAVVADLHRN